MLPPVNGYDKPHTPLIFLGFLRTKILKFLKFLKRRQQSCSHLQSPSLLSIQKQRTKTGELSTAPTKFEAEQQAKQTNGSLISMVWEHTLPLQIFQVLLFLALQKAQEAVV